MIPSVQQSLMKEILLICSEAGKCLRAKQPTDRAGMANGVMKYSIHLDPGEATEFFAAVPYHGRKSIEGSMDVKDIPKNFTERPISGRAKRDHITV